MTCEECEDKLVNKQIEREKNKTEPNNTKVK